MDLKSVLFLSFLYREYIRSKHTLSGDGSSMVIQLHSDSSSDSLDNEDHEDQDDNRSAEPAALLTEEDWG